MHGLTPPPPPSKLGNTYSDKVAFAGAFIIVIKQFLKLLREVMSLLPKHVLRFIVTGNIGMSQDLNQRNVIP